MRVPRPQAPATLAFCLLFSVAATDAFGQKAIPKPQAEIIARQKGWPIRKESPAGEAIELQKILNGIPLYYSTENLRAAASLSTDECWPGGATGLSLNGGGVTLGVWDGGRVRTGHQEFGGRAVQQDGSPTFLNHSTHVAGTMIGAGLSPAGTWPAGQSKGMSFAASLDCYDFSSDLDEMSVAAGAGLRVSNHSYGFITGWRFDDLGAGVGWYWLGDVTVNTFEDYFFGFYSIDSAAWDQIAYTKPYYLMVKSAGNDRNEGPSPGTTHFVSINGNWVQSNAVRSLDGNNGYDSSSHAGLSKNLLTVGAVNDVINGYSGPGSVTMSSFSAWGPADDGRIKPDIVGNGVDLYSASSSSNSAYTSLSGTSMSTPNVAGSLGLLIQRYRATHSEADMRAATLKALVIHTADECGGSTGPDYVFGWGLMNTASAATLIGVDQSIPETVQELALVSGEVIEQTWTSTGGSPIRVTISWTDPPGTPPPPSLDPTTPVLVNDLDLRIIGPGGTIIYDPWRLDVASPTSAATSGDNLVDNVEVVDIPAPPAGDYIVRVTHKGTLLDGLQRISLIVTGLTSPPAVRGACCVGEGCIGDLAEADCATATGEWYGGASCDVLTCPALGACCQGCPPSDTCTSRTLDQCNQVDGRWTEAADCGEVSCAIGGDDCDTDMQTIDDGLTAFDNRCATTDGPTPVTCENGSQPFGRDLWYRYVATCSGTLTVELCDETTFDAIMALYSSNTTTCPCPVNASLQIGTGQDDSCGVGGGPPRMTTNVVFGRCYTLRVAGWNSAAGSGVISITCDGPSCTGGPDAPTAEPAPVDKNRFFSFRPGSAGASTALRVRLASLHHPAGPPDAPDFTAMEGEYRWVNSLAAPSHNCPDSPAMGNSYKCAVLGCQPEYRDWGTEIGANTLHVTGEAVVPSSIFEVQSVFEGCDAQSESNYSAALHVTTGRWGDVDPPQLDVVDLSHVVDKVLDIATASSEPRIMLRPQALNPVANAVNVLDISDMTDALKEEPYPYAIPACP